MHLNPLARKRYATEVILDPVATGTWQVSFDGGVTWLDGTPQGDGSYAWMVSGPLNSGGSPVYTVPAGVTEIVPLLGLDFDGERIVVVGPFIEVG